MKDKKNAYTCEACHGSIITVDREEGTTPFMLRCRAIPDCTGMMRSQFYAQDERTAGEPQYEWRKPTPKEYRRMPPAMKQHIDMGGLEIYPIVRSEGDSPATRTEPPPSVVMPTATPSGCLADDYARARASGEHVRVLEDGQPTGQCWCGDCHYEAGPDIRDIHVRTVKKS